MGTHTFISCKIKTVHSKQYTIIQHTDCKASKDSNTMQRSTTIRDTEIARQGTENKMDVEISGFD